MKPKMLTKHSWNALGNHYGDGQLHGDVLPRGVNELIRKRMRSSLTVFASLLPSLCRLQSTIKRKIARNRIIFSWIEIRSFCMMCIASMLLWSPKSTHCIQHFFRMQGESDILYWKTERLYLKVRLFCTTFML